MTLLEQAIAFRKAFNQEILQGMVRFGFIKEKLFDMQAGLVAEEANEFLSGVFHTIRRKATLRHLRSVCEPRRPETKVGVQSRHLVKVD